MFLLVDVLSHGFELSEEAVSAFRDGEGSFGHAAALALLLVGGFSLGSAGLGVLERRLRRSAAEIWHGMRRHGHRELGLLLLAAGFGTGILTDLVVTYGGG